VRPSGTASTDAQVAEAKDVADRVVAYLSEQGWPEPILVASGNGFHLLYKNDGLDDSIWWKQCLSALANRFDTPGVKVDRTVHNKARILRAPATRNRKGDDTPERPHRLAKVVSYPDRPSLVPEKLVRALAPSDERVDHSTFTRVGWKKLVIDEDDLRDIILSYPEVLTLVGEEVKGTKTLFGLAECPFFDRAHNRQHVGVSKSAIIFDPTINQLGYKCFSDDCDGTNTFGMLRKLLENRTGRPMPQIYANEIDPDELLGRRGVEWVEGSEPVDPENGGEAGEILASFREMADPDPAWAMPTRESIHSEIKMARERGEPEIRQAAKRPPKPSNATLEQPRYLTVEELTLRLGLLGPNDPRPVKRYLTADELTVRLGLKDGAGAACA
jgi:hypothetical protein